MDNPARRPTAACPRIKRADIEIHPRLTSAGTDPTTLGSNNVTQSSPSSEVVNVGRNASSGSAEYASRRLASENVPMPGATQVHPFGLGARVRKCSANLLRRRPSIASGRKGASLSLAEASSEVGEGILDSTALSRRETLPLRNGFYDLQVGVIRRRLPRHRYLFLDSEPVFREQDGRRF